MQAIAALGGGQNPAYAGPRANSSAMPSKSAAVMLNWRKDPNAAMEPITDPTKAV